MWPHQRRPMTELLNGDTLNIREAAHAVSELWIHYGFCVVGVVHQELSLHAHTRLHHNAVAPAKANLSNYCTSVAYTSSTLAVHEHGRGCTVLPC